MSIQTKNFKKTIWMVGCLVTGVMLSGCSSTPRGLQHVPAQPIAIQDPVQTQEEHSFASTAGNLQVGVAGIIQATPIGLAQATVRSSYVNALGEKCKKIHLKSKSTETNCGVCLGKDGVWRYVPSVQ